MLLLKPTPLECKASTLAWDRHVKADLTYDYVIPLLGSCYARLGQMLIIVLMITRFQAWDWASLVDR
jgi:hypothetical protein